MTRELTRAHLRVRVPPRTVAEYHRGTIENRELMPGRAFPVQIRANLGFKSKKSNPMKSSAFLEYHLDLDEYHFAYHFGVTGGSSG